MQIKLGASCYVTDIERYGTFYHRGDIYVMVTHGDDRCQVRKVATRDESDMLTFVSCDVENFNSYAEVKPFTVEGRSDGES